MSLSNIMPEDLAVFQSRFEAYRYSGHLEGYTILEFKSHLSTRNLYIFRSDFSNLVVMYIVLLVS